MDFIACSLFPLVLWCDHIAIVAYPENTVTAPRRYTKDHARISPINNPAPKEGNFGGRRGTSLSGPPVTMCTEGVVMLMSCQLQVDRILSGNGKFAQTNRVISSEGRVSVFKQPQRGPRFRKLCFGHEKGCTHSCPPLHRPKMPAGLLEQKPDNKLEQEGLLSSLARPLCLSSQHPPLFNIQVQYVRFVSMNRFLFPALLADCSRTQRRLIVRL